MAHRVCPWWLGYFLISPVRRWMGGAPDKVLKSYIREGMTVLEPGPGMGYFTLEIARNVGTTGRVIAVDVQPKMVEKLKARAKRSGLLNRIDARVVEGDSMGLADLDSKVDFTLIFAMLHEVPAPDRFLVEIAKASRQGGTVLLAEPAGHVADEAFADELKLAAQAGLEVIDRPSIRRSHAALLKKS